VTARSKARKRAVDIVFEADLRGTDLDDTLMAWLARADPPVQEHAERLVRLVVSHQAGIDAAVQERLIDWSLQRVAPVDRAILRTASAELLFVDDVPDAVVLDEAVELAKSLSSDDSPAFVNGVLGRIAADKSKLLARAEGSIRSGGVDAHLAVGAQDPPGDETLGELPGALVVDHGE
jgi:N utilization substance protein B